MGIINTIKDSIENSLGNETIGEKEVENKKNKEKKVKKRIIEEKVIQKEKKKKVIKEEIIEEDIIDLLPKKTLDNKKVHPVLDLLGIDPEPNLVGLMDSKELEDIEFNITAPTGLDANQVEKVFDKVLNTLIKYENIVKKRQEDFVALVNEIKNLEQKIIEKQTENQLASFITEKTNNEEKLKEELLELKIENNELKEKLKKIQKQEKKQVVNKQKVSLPEIKNNNEEESVKKLLNELTIE